MSCDDVANVRFNVCKTMEKLVRYLLKNYFLHVSIYLRFFQSFQGLWNKDGKLILSKVKPVLKKLRTDKDSDVQYFAQVRVIFFVYYYYSNFASLKKIDVFQCLCWTEGIANRTYETPKNGINAIFHQTS